MRNYRWGLWFLLAGLLGLITPVQQALAAVSPEIRVEARSAILMEAGTGEIVFEQNADQRLPPASVTKVMTLLLAMEAVDRGELSLAEKVPVSPEAARMGGSQIWLKPGEDMTAADMIKAIAIVSANDACYALAERLSGSVEEDRPPNVMESLANLWFEITCGIDRQDPATILAAQLPPFEAMLPRIEAQVQIAHRLAAPPTQPPDPGEQPATPPAQADYTEAPFTPGQDPVVLILHTHTSESYVPDSGKAHVYNGQGDIVQVGRLLAQALQDKYGVPTIYTDRIHDQYPWHEAYIRSQQTILEYLRQYPSIKIIIDVHRDGTPGLEHTTVIDGRKSARVMLVVGTDRMGLSHPNWQKNNAFAERLKAQMDSLYPGLSLGIIKADARYNQHLCEKSVIAEVGGESCTLAEAETAVLELARVIADVVKNDPTLRQTR